MQPSAKFCQGFAKGKKGSGLLDVEDVPEYQRGDYILSGYRPLALSPWAIYKTAFTLHNETVNMWTHGLAGIYSLTLGIRFAMEIMEDCEPRLLRQSVLLLVVIAATTFLFFASFTYHLCKCGTEGVCSCACKWDQSGIVVLMGANWVAGTEAGFRCFPALCNFYLVYAAVVMSLIAAALVRPSFVSNLNRHWIICCWLGLVPVVHTMILPAPAGADAPKVAKEGGASFFVMAACYTAGAWFYMSKYPERRWPGRFDLFGHSHQIWHIFCVGGALSWIRWGFSELEHAKHEKCE